MTNKIFEALQKLDPSNDNHWTTDGLPRLDTVKMLAADPTLTREKVEEAVPGFKRSNAAEYKLPESSGDNTGQASTSDNTSEPGQVLVPPVPETPAAPAQVLQAQPQQEARNDDASVDGAALGGSKGEAQLGSLENGSVGDPDALEALEAELEEAEAYSAKLKAAQDKVLEELEKSVRRESDLRHKIEQAKPRNGVMPAIQAYFAAQDDAANKVAAVRAAISETGLDLTKIQALVGPAPVDKAAAQSNS